MIEDELDEDVQPASPVVERDVTVSFLFVSIKNKKEILTIAENSR
jgi:hypothetical protein